MRVRGSTAGSRSVVVSLLTSERSSDQTAGAGSSSERGSSSVGDGSGLLLDESGGVRGLGESGGVGGARGVAGLDQTSGVSAGAVRG